MLERALSAFGSGRFELALTLAAKVGSDDPLAAQALFIRGYALYKMQRLGEAARFLDLSLALRARPQVAYLRALLAYERGRYDRARRALALLEPDDDPRWRARSADLLALIKDKERSLAAKEARARAEQAYSRTIQVVRQHLEAGRLDEAARSLDAAERHLPPQVTTVYYRGYLAYLRGATDRAVTLFKKALQLSPEDSWSKYMLAISQSQRGDRLAAKAAFAELVGSGSDATAREKATTALAAMADAQVHNDRTRISFQLGAGSGLDTNPAYISDSGTDEAAGLALQGSVALAVARRISRRQVLSAGLRGFERAYVVGDNDAAQTDVGLWAAYRLTVDALQVEPAVGYSFFMFGHDPLLSNVLMSIGCGYRARSWLRLAVIPMVGRRFAHADSYRYLSATVIGSAAEMRVRWRAIGASATYSFSREWAPPMQVQDEAEIYLTDYTLTEHGPGLGADLTLPWRLRLSVTAGLQWRHFDNPDQLTSAGSTKVWSRQDVRVVGSAELKRSLGRGFDLGIRYESLDNLSSLGEAAPVDRNYSRRILGLIARWKGDI